ncbi:MAG: FecR domain-containing protein [Candidatus Omnitrophica bacterium]|nr:FecR domain-containing protein [Candidatus Omnitrophota bacterium]
MKKYKRFSTLLILFTALFLFPVLSPSASEPVGLLKASQGEVMILREGRMFPARAGDVLFAEDIIKTGAEGKASIHHNLGFDSEMGSQATLRVAEVILGIAGFSLARGWLETEGSLEDKAKQYRIATPVAITGVRGTGFLVIGSMDGASLVSVKSGTVSVGVGEEVFLMNSGERTRGFLAQGYETPESGQLTVQDAEAWRLDQEKDLKGRVEQVLDELIDLQKKEDADWEAIEREVVTASQKIMTGQVTQEDRFFFRKVFDLEDRMSARRLLAIDLREWAGLTDPEAAQNERTRLQKVWQARDWQRKTWEDVSRGKIPSLTSQPDNLKSYDNRAQKDMMQNQDRKRSDIPILPDTKSLFPENVEGVYLGMPVGEFRQIRPMAQLPPVMPEGDIPIVYTEKQLSGGDWSRPGWFTGMYTFYRGKMIQGTFLAFTGVETLRTGLAQKFTKLYGNPGRSRLEPDWAQPGVFKGSTLEWLSGDVEVILISRWVPSLQGNTRGLELRIRIAGLETYLENAGQFEENQEKLAGQLAIDFPEYRLS